MTWNPAILKHMQGRLLFAIQLRCRLPSGSRRLNARPVSVHALSFQAIQNVPPDVPAGE
jgi:hypothetical protein